MPSRIVFKPYKNGLSGMRAVKTHMRNTRNGKVLEVKVRGSRYRQLRNDVLIHWGKKNYVGKLAQYRAFGDLCAEFTTDIEEARRWIVDMRRWVVCRTLDNSFGGNGIVLAKTADELVPAKVYTRFIRCTEEYRMYVIVNRGQEVVGASVAQVRKKVRKNIDRRDEVRYNPYIKNHQFEWVFANVGPEDSDNITRATQIAIDSAKLMAPNVEGVYVYGVDIGISKRNQRPVLFEVNSSIGLDYTSAINISRAIQEMYPR